MDGRYQATGLRCRHWMYVQRQTGGRDLGVSSRNSGGGGGGGGGGSGGGGGRHRLMHGTLDCLMGLRKDYDNDITICGAEVVGIT